MHVRRGKSAIEMHAKDSRKNNKQELLEELKRLGYDERRRYFPPGQMAVIIKYLGD